MVVGLAFLGIQLLETTKKIKGFCESLKDAPEELQDTIEGIELMIRIISLMAPPDSEPFAEASVLAGSIELCEKALGRLTALADELQKRMTGSRRHLGRFAVVLNQESMNRLVRRLDQCKGLLTTAYLLYMGAQNRSRFDLQERLLGEIRTGQMIMVAQCTRQIDIRPQVLDPAQEVSTTEEENGSTLFQDQQAMTWRNKPLRSPYPQAMPLRFRTPRWPFSRVMELTMAQVPAGWTASLRFYRLIDWDDPMAFACMRNDLVTLRELVETGKATVHDQLRNGATLFESAMQNGAFDVCKFLYEHEAAAAMSWEELSVLFFWTNRLHNRIAQSFRSRQENAIELSRRSCIQELEQLGYDRSDPVFEDDEEIPGVLWDPIDVMSASDRLFVMAETVDRIYLKSSNHATTVDWLLEEFLGSGPIHPALLDSDAANGRSILHVFAKLHARFFRQHNGKASSAEEQAFHPAMLPRVAELIAANTDLHQRGIWGSGALHRNMTPLAVLFYEITNYFPINDYLSINDYLVINDHLAITDYLAINDHLAINVEKLDKALQSWAHLLQHSGVDLEAYGEREAAERYQYSRSSGFRVFGFSYGPKPADWHLWLTFIPSHEPLFHAATFWRLVEEPEPAIPGAWIDENALEEDEGRNEDWLET